jgi:hypothetical protein
MSTVSALLESRLAPPDIPDQPSTPAPAAALERTPAASATPRQLLLAAGGCLALDAAAALGAGDPQVAARALPAGLAIFLGTVLLTAPALVVAHQFLGLKAKPEELLRALSWGFVRCGVVALGLAPFALFFAATSSLWAVALCGSLFIAGLAGLSRADRELREVERGIGDAELERRRVGVMTLVVVGWATLSFLVALRITWDVARFVVGL